MVVLYLALPKTEAVDQVRAFNNFRNTIEAGSCDVRNIHTGTYADREAPDIPENMIPAPREQND